MNAGATRRKWERENETVTENKGRNNRNIKREIEEKKGIKERTIRKAENRKKKGQRTKGSKKEERI